MAQDSNEIILNPPAVPVLVEDPQDAKLIQNYDPKQQSLEDFLNIRFGPEMATINDDKRPERDTKNFPRLVRPLWPDKTRLFLIPESWFLYFYPKTGVTGPYVFLFGGLTFLLSKELYIIEHEFITGLCLAGLTAAAIQKWGQSARHWICDTIDEENRLWDNWQNGMMSFLNQMIDAETQSQAASKDQKVLFDAKRENIKLQLEAEFRRRQMAAYSEVRNRLEFHLAKQVAQRQYQQQHMVNWIIDSVAKSITPQQEKEAFKKCLSDLKQLSTKHSF